MMQIAWKFITHLAFFSLALVAPCPSWAEPIALSFYLPDRDGFANAGYYLAQDLGYFSQEGLDITLISGPPDQAGTALSREMAQFAIALPSIVLSRTQGQPVVVTGVVAQHSPLLLLSLRSSGLDSPQSLTGKRVMIAPPTQPNHAEIWAMLAHEGLTPTAIQQIPPDDNGLNALIAGQIDAMVGTPVDLAALDRGEVVVRAMSPRSYGVDFYGDALVTSEGLIARAPNLPAAMMRAVAKGWNWAMANPQEAVRLLSAHHDTGADPAQLLREAQLMTPLLALDVVEMGHSNPGRWKSTASAYATLGLLAPDAALDGLLLSDYRTPRELASQQGKDIAMAAAAIALVLWLVSVMFNSRLNAAVENRTRLLSESEERFRTLANSMPCPIWVSGADQSCRWVNTAWLTFTGQNHDQALADGWNGITHPEDWEQGAQAFALAVRSQQPFRGEFRMQRSDGCFRWMLVTGAPRLLDDGRFDGYVGTCQDITENKQAEANLTAQRTELRRSNEALQQFAFAAAHDLQDPLRMIASYIQLLDRRYGDILPPDARDFITFAIGGANHMQTVIDQLLDFSRLSGRPDTSHPVDLSECLASVLRLLTPAIREAKADIRIEALPMACGDNLLLGRLFQNLIGNALKFHDPATPPRIRVFVEWMNQNRMQIAVSDNGIGIAQENQHRVFGLFQRLHPQHGLPGSGIGLSLCHKIVELHDGHIWVESAGNGQGTTFHVELPRQHHATGTNFSALRQSTPYMERQMG